ncbi:MAG TPA: hypothetical protein VFD84_06970 [Candidatus Binatia bacterium]|jgi:hypothetical protein|nr:hypothetical protein [Candidatus Binatia bacterium]
MRTFWYATACAAACAFWLFGCRPYPGRPFTWSSTTMLEFDIAGPDPTELFRYEFANPYEAPAGKIRFSGLIKGDAAQKQQLPSELDFNLIQYRYSPSLGYTLGATYDLAVPVKKNGRFKVKENDFAGFTFGQYDMLGIELTPKDGVLRTNSMFAMTYVYVAR